MAAVKASTKLFAIGALALLGGAWLWTRGGDERPAPRSAATMSALAKRVLLDLAAFHGELTWTTKYGATTGPPYHFPSVEVRNVQRTPAAASELLGVVDIDGDGWSMKVATATITEIACHRHEPDLHPRVNAWMTFAGAPAPGDDPDGAAPTLFSVEFDDTADFRSLCARHRLPTHGDF